MQITPSRTLISDRFPVASFNVQVPPERLFEIACATDPRLFHPSQKHRRTPSNFFTTRAGGLMRASAGQATYLLPSDQLRRFAGAPRLYYALGTYRSPRGEDAAFSVPPSQPEQAPAIQLARDFTGRSLDRGRVSQKPSAHHYYGGAAGAGLAWGGDAAPTARLGHGEAEGAYDDGYGPWDEAEHVHDEPSGAEDAPELRRKGSAVTSGLHADEPMSEEEPPGYEDAPAIARAHAPVQAARYGRRAAPTVAPRAIITPRATTAPRAPTPRLGRVAVGRDVAFCETEPAGGDPYAAAVAALTIPEKLRIIQIVARAESGNDGYGAISADREFNDPQHPFYQKRHIGLSWGLIQFTQASGALGRVLAACNRRDPARFQVIFGDDAAELLDVTSAETEDERIAPVGGTPLWQEPWLGRFREASKVPAFQYAQNEIAVETYFDPNLSFAAWLGFDTDRALGMLYDRAIHMGTYGGRRFVLDVVSPLRTPEDRARVLKALGFDDLKAFQDTVDDLPSDGRFGVMTHAALLGAACRLGERSPCPLPPLPQMLDALQTAAASTGFAARVKALRESHDFNDARLQVA